MKRSLNWLDVGGERLAVEVYGPTTPSKLLAGVLVLHGAGQSDKSRCREVCLVLAGIGCECVSFDFSGAGQSTRRHPQTLAKRTAEAQAVFESYLPNFAHRSVVAFSMSGHSAIELAATPRLGIRGLILCSPAIYAEQAYEIPFGPEFTSCLRQPLSWRSSASFRKLAKFDGRVCLVLPERDEVIPDEVFTLIERALPHPSFHKIVVKESSHTLGAWFNDHPDVAEAVIGDAWAFIATDDHLERTTFLK